MPACTHNSLQMQMQSQGLDSVSVVASGAQLGWFLLRALVQQLWLHMKAVLGGNCAHSYATRTLVANTHAATWGCLNLFTWCWWIAKGTTR